MAAKCDVIEQLRQRVKELETDFRVEQIAHLSLTDLLEKELAASQAQNLRLRSALEYADNNKQCPLKPEYCDCIVHSALSTPTDTDALEQYVTDRLEQIANEAPINGNQIAQARILLAAQQLKEKP